MENQGNKIEYFSGEDAYKREQYKKTVETLNKLSEIIAFINVYGPLYYSYYEGFIVDLNNISEHFLQSSDSKVIDELYVLFVALTKSKKTTGEIFEELKTLLNNLPHFQVDETPTRENRRQW